MDKEIATPPQALTDEELDRIRDAEDHTGLNNWHMNLPGGTRTDTEGFTPEELDEYNQFLDRKDPNRYKGKSRREFYNDVEIATKEEGIDLVNLSNLQKKLKQGAGPLRTNIIQQIREISFPVYVKLKNDRRFGYSHKDLTA